MTLGLIIIGLVLTEELALLKETLLLQMLQTLEILLIQAPTRFKPEMLALR